MLERVVFFSVHSVVHLSLYTLPRLLFALCVRLPRTLWDWVTRRKQRYSFERERRVEVVVSETDKSAGSRLLRLFGLRKDLRYDGPMYSGHIHTMLGGARLPRRVNYERELVDADDGNPMCLDWLKVPANSPTKVKGVMLIVPGLGNYGQTCYIQRAVRNAVRRGYHCCVLTPRGMGSAPLTKPQLTCVTFTADIRCAMHKIFQREQIEARFGQKLPCFAVGYSAGGTSLVIAVAQELQLMQGQTSTPDMYPGGFPFECCICVSAPYDMPSHAAAMLSRVGRLMYQAPLLSALRKYTHKHRAVLIGGLPGIPEINDHTVDAFMARLKTVEDFDEHVVTPHFGYKRVEDYYADGSLFKWLPLLHTIPIVCARAHDDPITGCLPVAADWQRLVDSTCSNVVFVETPTGGHLGYMMGPLDEWRRAPSFLDSFPLECVEHMLAAKASDPTL